MIYTSDLLLQSIKTRAMIPSSQNTFSDADLLNLANEEMETFIVGTIMRVQQEYLVVTDSLPLVKDQVRYRIPPRAIGQKVRDVTMTSNGSTIPVPRYLRENKSDQTSVDGQFGFYIENNYIVLLSAPSTSQGTLDVSYFLRTGQIVDSTMWQNVVSVAGNVIGVSSILPGFVVGAKIDVITAMSGSETILRDANILSVDLQNKTITLDQSCALVQVGDYVCFAGQSAVPQCPEEMHPLLAQRVICRVLEALNDQNGLAAASQKLQLMEQNILALIDNRIVGKPLKIVNNRGLLAASIRANPRFTR
jgi:hypothetical protein